MLGLFKILPSSVIIQLNRKKLKFHKYLFQQMQDLKNFADIHFQEDKAGKKVAIILSNLKRCNQQNHSCKHN